MSLFRIFKRRRVSFREGCSFYSDGFCTVKGERCTQVCHWAIPRPKEADAIRMSDLVFIHIFERTQIYNVVAIIISFTALVVAVFTR